MIRIARSLSLVMLSCLAVSAPAAPIDNVKQKVSAFDSTHAHNPPAAVDGKGGGSPDAFTPATYVHRYGLNHMERTGSPEFGGAGWIDTWTNDCSEPASPTPESPARLRLDYQKPEAIAQFALYFPCQGNMDGYLPELAHAAAVKTVEVFRSDDGATWESAVRIQQLEWTHPQIVRIPNPIPARYYLFSFEAMAPGNNALRLYEIEAYTDPKEPIATKPITPQAEPAAETPTGSGPSSGNLAAGAWKGEWQADPAGLKLNLEQGAARFAVPIDLKPDNQTPAAPWQSMTAKSGTAGIAAPASGGSAMCRITAEELGVRLTVTIPPPAPWTARGSVMVRVPVANAKFRFLPEYLGSTEPAKSAWPGWYLPTVMASITTDQGTIALAPSTDRHRIGIDGDSMTIRLFPDETGEASILLIPVDGDWVKAFQTVVYGVWDFKTLKQYRPAAQTALGMIKWLMVDSVWSEEWQQLRSFPDGEFFFVFYGAPYAIPALWQRAIIAGDAEAERKVKLSAKFLLEAPVRVKDGPMKGGFYSQMAGTKAQYTLTDQAHQHWMVTHTTGAAIWALLYHQTMLPQRDPAIDAAIVESADHLLRLQQPDGGWFYAYFENGTLGTGHFMDSGTIWNIWSLWRAGKALGREDYLEAARRGRDWWVAKFLDKHHFTGYWEDSNHKGVIWPTRDGYPAQMATLAFLEMGDTQHAVESANFLATWIHTRTPYYRDYWTGYGNMGEQWTWPANIYLVPGSAYAFQQIEEHAPQPEMFRAFTTIAKSVAWWVDEEGSGYFPSEASGFTAIHKTELSRSYWVDWCGAQEGSRTIMWMLAEVNKRCGGRIAIDPETLRGTVDGKAAHPWQPDGSVTVRVPGEGTTPQANQLNWMGYRAGDTFYLAVLNDQPEGVSGVTVELGKELGEGRERLDLAAGEMRVLSWRLGGQAPP